MQTPSCFQWQGVYVYICMCMVEGMWVWVGCTRACVGGRWVFKSFFNYLVILFLCVCVRVERERVGEWCI